MQNAAGQKTAPLTNKQIWEMRFATTAGQAVDLSIHVPCTDAHTACCTVHEANS